jgi:hypothetical protein
MTELLGSENGLEDRYKSITRSGTLPEQILREEIRSIREMYFRMIQWGVTVLTAGLTIVFYGRRAFRDDFVDAGALKVGQQLPFKYYIVGTIFLAMIAFIFSVLTITAIKRLASYRRQLNQLSAPTIVEPPASRFTRWLFPVLFFLFPAFDLAVRIYFFEIGLPSQLVPLAHP